MRIIGGRFKGLGLAAVGKGDRGAHLRPTPDRMRESLFNLLQGGRFGDPVTDAIVLDLFAGTGALGLEALSRGALSVRFVDDGRVANRLLKENIAKAGVKDEVSIVRRDATRISPCEGEPATLVFLDPPYGKLMGEKALAAAVMGGWIAENALIVWEENAHKEAPVGFRRLDSRQYGGSCLTILEKL